MVLARSGSLGYVNVNMRSAVVLIAVHPMRIPDFKASAGLLGGSVLPIVTDILFQKFQHKEN
uniref:Xanthine permease n=1 Tax=Angiostrongylus cantonensis TaxID=6313 RepID=A0A0K0D8P6_ANGCA